MNILQRLRVRGCLGHIQESNDYLIPSTAKTAHPWTTVDHPKQQDWIVESIEKNQPITKALLGIGIELQLRPNLKHKAENKAANESTPAPP